MMRYSIRTYLLLLVAALAIPLVVIVGYTIYSDVSQAVHEARLSTRTLAKIVAANTNRTLDNSREAMENLGQRPLMRAVDRQRCDPILSDFRQLFPRFANLATVNMEGLAVCSAVAQPGGKPVTIAATEWFQRFLTTRHFLVGKPFVGPITGRWVSVLVVPLTGAEDTTVGAIGLPLDLDEYNPGLGGLPLAPDSRYGLITKDGVLVWRNEDREGLIGRNLVGHDAVDRGLQIGEGEYEALGTDGVRRLYSVIPIPQAEWFAFVGVPTSALYARAKERAFYGSVSALLIFAVIAVLAVWLANKISAPVLSLASISRAVRTGQHDARATASGPQELEEVVSEFNAMVEEKMHHEIELDFLAHHDALTRLPNRVLLRDRMQLAMALAHRQERLLGVCYLDLDGFKQVNDHYGHKLGDLLLVEVSKRLEAAVRSGDTVARLGGDEFVLLIGALNSVAELESILERLQANIASPYSLEGHELALSASLGVALYPMDDNEADILLRHADQAMYEAKQAGKNSFSFFDPEEELRARKQQHMRERVQLALVRQELRLHYQPKVDMRSGQIIGAEALIRWQHPEQGLLGPGQFLPLVEETDLITAIGNWVMEEALAQIERWTADGFDIVVSINIAARQIRCPDFVEGLKMRLAAHAGVRPDQLELEILETAALGDIALVSRVMHECLELGVGFALDDFGTGYSSLEYLKRLPAQTLKIDQSFVRDLLDDPDDMAITEGILGLARAFQRTPIAEGVETIAHGTVLLHLGCDLAQGYAVARPMPPEQLPEWAAAYCIDAQWKEAAAARMHRDDFPLLAIEVQHRRWVARIVTAVEAGDLDAMPSDIPDHNTCRFGRWHQGEGKKRYGQLALFQEIGARHQEVHLVAAQVSRLLAKGDVSEAVAALTELRIARDTLLDTLHRLQSRVAAA